MSYRIGVTCLVYGLGTTMSTADGCLEHPLHLCPVSSGSLANNSICSQKAVKLVGIRLVAWAGWESTASVFQVMCTPPFLSFLK